MNNGSHAIKIVAVINPCLYGITYEGRKGHSIAGIYGIAPPEFTVSNVTTKQIPIILDNWKKLNNHIKELISSSEKVQFLQECVVDGIPFGNFILTESNSNIEVSLNEFLLETTIGVKSKDPLKDALIIKDNSIKPGDLSVSSSDESYSSSDFWGKRRSKTYKQYLKKPNPLLHVKKCIDLVTDESVQPQEQADISICMSQKDSSVVRDLLCKQFVTQDFIHRYTSPPNRDIFDNPTPSHPIIQKPKIRPPSKDFDLNHYLSVGETEITANYLNDKEAWLDNLAKQFVKNPLPKTEMTSTSAVTPETNFPKRGEGRGLMKTIRERYSLENVPTQSTLNSSGMGRGHYMNSDPVNSPLGRGRGLHSLRSMQEKCSVSNLGQGIVPGDTRRAFSIDPLANPSSSVVKTKDNTCSSDISQSQSRNDIRESNYESDTGGSLISADSVINNSVEDETHSSLINSLTDEHNSSDAEKQDSIVNGLISDTLHFNDFLDRIIAFGGLVHGNNILPPVNEISDLGLHSMIFESIKNMKIRDLNRTQSHSIKHIINRRNVVIIGPHSSGKTFAAIVSLLSLLCDMKYYSNLKEGSGPKAVFIVSCSSKVRSVVKDMNEISHLNIIGTHGGGLELTQMCKLVNGCDILVSTPRCWLRLLTYKWVINISRLCHLYVDDLDDAMNLFQSELMTMFRIFDDVKEKRGVDGPIPQIVLIGETWFPIFDEIVLKRLNEPIICWTSFLEAALYSNVKPRLHILSPEKKLDKLEELLDEREKVPTVIVCNSSDEVKLLKRLLFSKRSKVFAMHTGTIFMCRDVYNDWYNCLTSKNAPLLIACDDTLVDLGISNAEWLIQYSLPESKTEFNYRFCTIKSNFIDRISNKGKRDANCFIDILVDHTVEKQLPDIVIFMKRLKTVIPEEIQNAVDKILKKKEDSKSCEVGLCQNLIQFGNCWNEFKCNQQHTINYNRDKPRDLPISGFVRFTILKAHSPIHFSVRLIAHTEDSNITSKCWTPLPSHYTALALQINKYYSNRNNRRMHGSVQIGDLAAVEVEMDSQYRRVKVLQIIKKDEKHVPVTVKVHFVDAGVIKNIKACLLLHLPNELRAYPRTSVDMYLIGLVPVDLDKDWSCEGTNIVMKKFTSLPENHILVAKVTCVFGFILMVESLKAVENLEISKCTVVHMSLRDFLLDHNIAVKNPKHLESLIELCREGNLTISTTLPSVTKKECTLKKRQLKKSQVQNKHNEKVMWAYLSKEEKSSVILSSAESPSEFYVSHIKFTPLLEKLEREISQAMDKDANFIDVKDIYHNMICLAKCDDRWNRAILLDEPTQKNEEDQLIYPLRFVDYGDTLFLPASEIAYCPEKFISSLPFQAIKCSLIGLNPLNGEWSTEAGDALYDLSQSTAQDGSKTFRELHVIVAGFINASVSAKSGKHYKVILIDNTKGNEIIINKEMVIQGHANWNPEEKLLLDNIDISSFQLTSNHSDDESLSGETFSEVTVSDMSSESEIINSMKSIDINSDETTDSNPRQVSDMPNNKFLDWLENYDINLGHSGTDGPLSMLAALQKQVLSAAGREVKPLTCKSKNPYHNSLANLSSENDADISEFEDSNLSKAPLTKFHLKSGFFTPKTGWLQSDTYVYIRILLPGVNHYKLHMSSRHIDFSTTYDGKRYRLFIDLFGNIVQSHSTHASKGQYVEIKALKLLTDIKWPRLLYDEKEKPIWLQVESVSPKSDDISHFVPTEEFKHENPKYDEIFLDDDQSDESENEIEDENFDYCDFLSLKS